VNRTGRAAGIDCISFPAFVSATLAIRLQQAVKAPLTFTEMIEIAFKFS
jgi:hypothetical protein